MHPLKSLLRTKGVATFDILHCSFESGLRRDQDVKVIRHDDKGVKQIRVAAVMLKNFLK